MITLSLVFLIVALILFILAGIPVPSRFGLGWWGLAFLTLAMLVGEHVLTLH